MQLNYFATRTLGMHRLVYVNKVTARIIERSKDCIYTLSDRSSAQYLRPGQANLKHSEQSSMPGLQTLEPPIIKTCHEEAVMLDRF
jgi:hypothetical protein